MQFWKYQINSFDKDAKSLLLLQCFLLTEATKYASLYKEPQILFRKNLVKSWLENDFCPILYSLFFFFIFRSEIRLMTQQHAISKEGVTYQELQEMKNKLMALLENNATIYNLVQKYPFGMNWFSILFPTLFQLELELDVSKDVFF